MKNLLSRYRNTQYKPMHIKIDGTVEILKVRNQGLFAKLDAVKQFIISFMFAPLP